MNEHFSQIALKLKVQEIALIPPNRNLNLNSSHNYLGKLFFKILINLLFLL